MQIRVSNPTLVGDLAGFLVRAACDAVPRGRTIDVTLPHATSDRQARLYLDLYVKAWSGLNPNVLVDIVDEPSGRWPW